MNLRFLCTILLFLSAGVLGSVNSAPYTALTLWYMYRMDVIVSGPGKTEIVPELKGSAPDGTFYFDEFVQYTQYVSANKRKKSSAWKGNTGVGKNLNPDVESTARKLAETGFTRQFKPSLVYPSKWTGNAVSTYDQFFGALTDRVQALRAKNPAAIELQLDRLRESLKPVINIRFEDQTAGFFRDLNSWFKAQTKITWETKTVDGPDGTKLTQIDTETTLKKNTIDMATMKKDLISFIATYQTQHQKGKSHYAAITSSQRNEGRIMGDSTC
ncbi:hypothetical protein N7539_005687 [Penicillium diatomitis]|uniref:Uncharacterized protein n=1 Tax=Penicillium diatomitis TaxID=2819901 RepID=A0A9X0BUZ8_9EURO|nr:uncharacterized protein N7539_005687 [Penicillium diatomitis]KAJ5485699.1 hypothetical protein N7539_005687 [Penicillium diatomitis]